jgi:hypothetical protein
MARQNPGGAGSRGPEARDPIGDALTVDVERRTNGSTALWRPAPDARGTRLPDAQR